MRLAFTINPLRSKNEIQNFQEVLENGLYQGIEIFYPKESNYLEYTNALMEIKKQFPNIEFVMHLPHGKPYSLTDFNIYKENLKIMKDAISYASQFGVKKLTLHLGFVDLEKDRNSYIEHIVFVLKDLCEFAKGYGMYVMLENMPSKNELGYSPDEIFTIIKLVNVENLKFILDTGHANVSEYEIIDYVNLLKEYLLHLHLNDNDGSRDMHAPFGKGNIDFKKFLTLMEEINYDGLYCLEILYNTKEELENNAKALLSYKN